jgi:hypothetical protein
MNTVTEKIENIVAQAPKPGRPDSSASDSAQSPELTGETSLDEDSGRRLYRRSVAYFFFGFGSNKNAILTDEP